MGTRRKYLPCVSVLLALLFGVFSVNSLQFSGERRMLVDTIHTRWYFPHENSICVVLAESNEEKSLPVFHIPMVIYSQDHVLQNCGGAPTEQDGYVFITSNTEHLQEQIILLLKCFNQTNLRLQNKYILVLDPSENDISNYIESYANVFHNLWKSFGIINIAIISVQGKNVGTKAPLVCFYNPFLGGYDPSPGAIEERNLSQDIRGVMTNRFRDMNGHRLRSLFIRLPNSFVTFEDLSAKQTLGSDTGVLYKQILEEKFNVIFDVYEPVNSYSISSSEIMEEIISGRAEYCINFLISERGVTSLSRVQMISSGIAYDLVFVVPKPRRIESWRFFQYIFKWQVCVGLGIVMILLSSAALLFHYVQSTNINRLRYSSSGTSEVVSVWKAALSVSTRRLPSSHSQRLLIACSLLLSLIFLTLFSAQLFGLIKSKPRLQPIRTLQDLHDSDLPIYTIYNHLSPFLNVFENTTLHKLKENLKADNMYDSRNFMDPSYLNISDRALLYIDSMVKAVASLPQNKEYLQYFEVLKEPVVQSMLVAYTSMGSVYYDHFNDLSQRLICGGLYQKWSSAKSRRVNVGLSASSTQNATQGSHEAAKDDSVPLSYEDLKMAFYTLYIGLTLSTLCFLKEFCNF